MPSAQHQPAAIAREAEAIEPHHVDFTGAVGLALFEDLAGFVDRGAEEPAQDGSAPSSIMMIISVPNGAWGEPPRSTSADPGIVERILYPKQPPAYNLYEKTL